MSLVSRLQMLGDQATRDSSPVRLNDVVKLIWAHPSNRGRRGRAVLRAAAWQLFKRTVGRPITVRAYDAYRIRCYPNDHEGARFLYFHGNPDYHQAGFIRRYLQPGDWFIDCGAHLGTYTILAASLVGPTGSVHAFEASPAALTLLCENLSLNSLTRVHVHASAVADKPGTIPFVVDRKGGSGNRIRTSLDRENLVVEVAAVRMQDVLPSGPYAMAKLDIEGAEARALKGAEEMLRRASPPVWQFEAVDRFLRRYGSSLEELVHWLDGLGYGVAVYDADANRLTMGDEVVGSRTDLLAIARAQLDTVVARTGCDVSS